MELETFEAGPIDRLMLALYAGASGDHAMMHLDGDIARSVGLPDQIGHGLLTMAIIGRALKRWYGLDATRKLAVRFQAIVLVGETVYVSGTEGGTRQEDGETIQLVDIIVRAGDDRRQVLAGSAEIVVETVAA